MPIRPEFRHLYGKQWLTVTRPRILARAGGRLDPKTGKYLGGARCEDCGVPDRTRVARAIGWWMIPPEDWWLKPWTPDGFGKRIVWNHAPHKQHVGDNFPRSICNAVWIVICVCHLDHTPGHDDEGNLRALCQWCHLHMDEAEHRKTRMERKDAGRPLLVGRP